MRPLRAMTATAPGIFFAWISSWNAFPIRPSRSLESPTSSGRAVGSASAHDRELKRMVETTSTPRIRRMKPPAPNFQSGDVSRRLQLEKVRVAAVALQELLVRAQLLDAAVAQH